jgi:hypothetical protein
MITSRSSSMLTANRLTASSNYCFFQYHSTGVLGSLSISSFPFVQQSPCWAFLHPDLALGREKKPLAQMLDLHSIPWQSPLHGPLLSGSFAAYSSVLANAVVQHLTAAFRVFSISFVYRCFISMDSYHSSCRVEKRSHSLVRKLSTTTTKNYCPGLRAIYQSPTTTTTLPKCNTPISLPHCLDLLLRSNSASF